MIKLKSIRELRQIQQADGPQVLLPMDVFVVDGIHNIYCPHCGQSVFNRIPSNKNAVGVCANCGGKFYLKYNQNSMSQRI